MADKVTITPADGKIIFEALVDGSLVEVGSIDADPGGPSADEVVMAGMKMSGGTF